MDLTADCSRCLGLCCVALPFARSADFAIDKPAGEPCPNLRPDFGCGIHARLREDGFRGCSAFDCFGAGQQVCQETFRGRSWRDDPETAAGMFEVFAVMRQLHELAWLLTEARALPEAGPLREDLDALLTEVEAATRADAQTLAALDVSPLRHRVRPLLAEVGELVRAEVPGSPVSRAGADLVGARLSGADLRGADLRGALLIAADLTGADLRRTDLLGADLRDADLSGADLSGSVFVTQPQLDAARGDAATLLPGSLDRPAHWP